MNTEKQFEEKIIAFPCMGNCSIALKSIFETMGAKVLITPQNNKESLTIGTRFSSETVCLPYKLNLGNYIQALEKGANVLVMFQAPGTCRLGNYASMAEYKLRELGYEFDMVVFDLYKGKIKEILTKFSRACGNTNILTAINGLKIGLAKFNALDEMERKLFYIRARELEKGNALRIYKLGLELIDSAKTIKAIKAATKDILEKFEQIKIDKSKEVLKVYLTGEFFVLLDPFTNMEIEKELGNLNVEIERQVMLSDWTKNILIPGFINRKESHRDRSMREADQYIKRAIGGDCIESIGDAVHASHSKVDGVVHLSPFNCIPEIVSQCILPKVSKQENIPVISLIIDEHTGKAGFITRLEAFVDLLNRRKNTQKTA